MARLMHHILALVCRFLPTSLRVRLWNRVRNSERWEFGLFMKYCKYDYEAQVLRFVAQHTSIPVPMVIDNVKCREDGIFLLVMTLLPGDSLCPLYREMTEDQLAHLQRQISRHLAELRAISVPGSTICRLGGKPVRDARLSLGMHPWGPFDSVSEFHEAVIQGGRLDIEDSHADEVYSAIRKSHGKTHGICFTHGDLHPDNVLADEDGNVAGIIDWEMSEWLPEYWEFTKSVHVPFFNKGKWLKLMSNVFPEYKDELAAEKATVRWRTVYG